MIKGASHLLAAFCATVAIVHAYGAFGQGEPQGGPIMMALGQVGLCILFSHVVWERVPQFLSFPRRETVATFLVVAAMIAVMTAFGAERRPDPNAWRWAIAALSLFGLALHSLQSFLLFLTIYASLLLVGLSLRPSGMAALLFSAGAVLLLASLAHTERCERFPAAADAPNFPHSASMRSLRAMGALAVLFVVFYATKPAAQAITAEEWIRWLRDGPVDPMALGGGSVDELQAMSEDPFGQSGRGSDELDDEVSAGFSGDLKFGDQGGPRQAVAFLAQVRGVEGDWFRPGMLNPFWKAAALSDYDGRRWRADTSEVRELEADDGWVELSPGGAVGPLIEQRFVVSPFGDRSVFALYPLERIGMPSVAVDREGVVRSSSAFRSRFKYRAVSRLIQVSAGLLENARATHPDPRYLSVPIRLGASDEFRRYVRQIEQAGRSDIRRVLAAVQILQQFNYTLAPGFEDYRDPTLEFLRQRRGYCQHFASALALLLRGLGIPTRLVLGFAGGDLEQDGTTSYYVVRRTDAHAWVEVHFERYGWLPFDAAAGPASVFEQQPLDRGRVEPLPEGIVETGPDPSPETSPGSTPREFEPVEPDQPGPRPSASESPSPTESASPSPAEIPENTPRPSRSPGGQDRPSPSASPDASPSRTAPSPGPSASRPSPRPTRTWSPPPEAPEADSQTNFDRIWGSFENRGGNASRGGDGGSDSADARGGGTSLLGPLAGGSPGPASDESPLRGSLHFALGTLVREVAFAGGAFCLLLAGGWVWRQRRREEEDDEAAEDAAQPFELEGSVATAAPPRYEVAGTSEFEVVAIYQSMLKLLSKRGFQRHLAETPFEFVRRGAGHVKGVAPLSTLFVQARYGPNPIEEEQTARARYLLAEVENGLRRG